MIPTSSDKKSMKKEAKTKAINESVFHYNVQKVRARADKKDLERFISGKYFTGIIVNWDDDENVFLIFVCLCLTHVCPLFETIV